MTNLLYSSRSTPRRSKLPASVIARAHEQAILEDDLRDPWPRKKPAEGTTVWKNKEGGLHREDGPAVEWDDGTREWWLNDKRHREDGPAFEGADGTREWWLDGEELTVAQWKKRTGN